MICGLLSWSSWALPWRKKDGEVMWPSPPHFFTSRPSLVPDFSRFSLLLSTWLFIRIMNSGLSFRWHPKVRRRHLFKNGLDDM